MTEKEHTMYWNISKKKTETGLWTNMSLHKKNFGTTDERNEVISFLQLGCTISLITINTWCSSESASATVGILIKIL